VIYSIENYTYNELGNITAKEITGTKDKLSSRTTDYTYYDNGSRKSVTYPDGTVEKYTYNRDGLNTGLVNEKADGTMIESFNYTYDEAHNQTCKTDAKGTTAYTYDRLNRLWLGIYIFGYGTHQVDRLKRG
jgi:uncharacterized protein RhaS with RHS repeats